MAITTELNKNGILLEKAYVRPVYLAINFDGGLEINFETFPTEEQLGKFPNEQLPNPEILKEESDAIKAIVYGIMHRTELLKKGIPC